MPDASTAPGVQPAALNAMCREASRPAQGLVLVQLTSRPQAQDFGLNTKHINVEQAASQRSRARGQPHVKPSFPRPRASRSPELQQLWAEKSGGGCLVLPALRTGTQPGIWVIES